MLSSLGREGFGSTLRRIKTPRYALTENGSEMKLENDGFSVYRSSNVVFCDEWFHYYEDGDVVQNENSRRPYLRFK
jgi:hypothetical protein